MAMSALDWTLILVVVLVVVCPGWGGNIPGQLCNARGEPQPNVVTGVGIAGNNTAAFGTGTMRTLNDEASSCRVSSALEPSPQDTDLTAKALDAIDRTTTASSTSRTWRLEPMPKSLPKQTTTVRSQRTMPADARP